MNVQVIEREGQPEYAVLAWADYQELLRAAGRLPASAASTPPLPQEPVFSLESLRSLREARRLAPEQLARAVGISPHYLTLIESGERQPDQAIVRALARLFATPDDGSAG
ncbi:helix-turn-helix transcriptional regulator [Pseudomonas sp. A-1]|jgi:DNA-binding XRE family transcriptional regulator|uniref:helix-turn-helix transcriptional regulator n=1 Tax=Pseudomonas sp. A-1 TaxID=1821274 RepID=UPI0010A5FC72|nr:helix-turn-helix transcriptional regulator [Pseudomonas sp. A-1]THG79116.1 helix-turn-helix transcriptional regulator [Pseudomonas sp. A-1]